MDDPVISKRLPHFTDLRWGMTVLAAMTWCVVAQTCPYSIRDAGFIVHDPHPYELAFLTECSKEKAIETERKVTKAADVFLADSNVVARVINLREDSARRYEQLAERLGVARFPAAALIASDDRAFLLKTFDGPALTQEAIENAMQMAVASPKRAEIKKHIITAWCVVILVEGENAKESDEIVSAINAAGKSILGTVTEMGKTIRVAPWLVRLRLNEEKTLRWSLGLGGEVETSPRVAIVFGALRRLGPAIIGAEATQQTLSDLFLLLGRNCTCTSDPSRILGPCAPVVWGRDEQIEVRNTLGFDANNPAVIGALSGVWKTVGDQSASGLGDLLDGAGLGYTEITLDYSEKKAVSESPDQTKADSAAEETPPPDDRAPRLVSVKAADENAEAKKTQSLVRSLVAGEKKDGAKPAVTSPRGAEDDAVTRRSLRGFLATLAVVAVFVLLASLLIAFIRGRRK